MRDIDITCDLRAQGYAAGEISRLSKAGELRRIRRGAYGGPLLAALDPEPAHLELLEATMRQSSSDLVASGMTAAVVHGLPVWRDHLRRVQLTRDRAGGRKLRRYSEIRSIPLAPDEVVLVNGFLVTSLARTVLDLSCALPMRAAVAIGDAALRQGLGRAELEVALERARGRHGIGRARRATSFLDARSESPGESESRVVLHAIGIPKPDLQAEVRHASGRLLGRCDFDWPEFGTVGEFDGLVKYGRTLQPDQRIEDVLVEEKLREDAIRDEGRQMVRWIRSDLHPAYELRDRLLRAFARGRRAP